MKHLRRVWLALVGVCVSQLVCAESLRVATYNLDNYLVANRRVGNEWRPNYPKPESEKQIIRRVIQEVSPDILVVQEIGTIEFLRELQADMAMEGVDYPYTVHLQAEDLDRHIAILSKLPPSGVVRHTDLAFNYMDQRVHVKRGLLEVSFGLANGQFFDLFAVHLKSRLTVDRADPESRIWRTKEAEACRNRIIERTFERDRDAFLVVGDFNDHPDSAVFRRFFRRGDMNISYLLPAFDSRGERWTYYYSKSATYSLADAILVSPAIKPLIHDGRGTIVDRPCVLAGSDHRMVYTDLSFSGHQFAEKD